MPKKAWSFKEHESLGLFSVLSVFSTVIHPMSWKMMTESIRKPQRHRRYRRLVAQGLGRGRSQQRQRRRPSLGRHRPLHRRSRLVGHDLLHAPPPHFGRPTRWTVAQIEQGHVLPHLGREHHVGPRHRLGGFIHGHPAGRAHHRPYCGHRAGGSARWGDPHRAARGLGQRR